MCLSGLILVFSLDTNIRWNAQQSCQWTCILGLCFRPERYLISHTLSVNTTRTHPGDLWPVSLVYIAFTALALQYLPLTRSDRVGAGNFLFPLTWIANQSIQIACFCRIFEQDEESETCSVYLSFVNKRTFRGIFLDKHTAASIAASACLLKFVCLRVCVLSCIYLPKREDRLCVLWYLITVLLMIVRVAKEVFLLELGRERWTEGGLMNGQSYCWRHCRECDTIRCDVSTTELWQECTFDFHFLPLFCSFFLTLVPYRHTFAVLSCW